MINLSTELQNNKYFSNVLNDMAEKELTPPRNFNLSILRADISKYKWSLPRRVQIPKSNGGLRDIFIFNEEDSFLLKVLNNIFCVNESNKINQNVFSYQKGKRTFDAMNNIRVGLINNSIIGFKCDIKNYFMSVNQKSIFHAIDELVEDNSGRTLLKNLFSINKFIDSKTNTIMEQYLGIMPGSALSSFFANYMLKDIDLYLSKSAKVYSRYADDIIFFLDKDVDLQAVLGNLESKLEILGLNIHPKKQKVVISNDTVEFLGLDLSKNIIDISKDTFKRVKKVILRVCKSTNLQDFRSKEDAIRHTIRKLNRTLYWNVLKAGSEHKSCRMNYIFANVTTDKTLKEIDFYMLDTLNYLVTGKHNKSPKRWSVSKFEELGFKSCVQLWNLYKMNLSIYRNEVFLLDKCYLSNQLYAYSFHHHPRRPSKDIINVYWKSSFSDLFYWLLDDGNNNNFFYVNGIPVYPEGLVFDIVNHEIRFNGLVLVSKEGILFDSILVCRDNKFYDIHFVDKNLITSMPTFDLNDLYKMYIQASYSTDYSCKYPRVLRGFNKIDLFRDFKLDDVYSEFGEEFIDVETPYQVRRVKFISCLWFIVTCGIKCSGLDISQQFILLGNKRFPLVLKSNWFLNTEKEG